MEGKEKEKSLELKMQEELKENNVVDNPLDIMLYFSLELARDLLFASHRIKNSTIPQQLRTKLENLEFNMNKIKEEFSKIENMSEETVRMLRKTSHYFNNDEFEKANKYLIRLERVMDTLWTESVPCRNDRFERIRLGEESEEYKRLLELKNIIDNSEELSSVDDKYLHSLSDVLYDPNECIDNLWMSPEEVREKQEIINKYHLTQNDIDYMIAYRNKEIRAVIKYT